MRSVEHENGSADFTPFDLTSCVVYLDRARPERNVLKLRKSAHAHANIMLLDHKTITTGPVGSRPSPASRFLFYSHDGFGLGHTRRHLAVARALTELAPDSSVLLATGSDVVSRLGL